MLKTQDFLDVQLVYASAAILRDSMNQHCDFRYWWIHSVQQSQFEWNRYLREALRPVRLDLAVFDLLSASDDLCQPLALDGRRYSVITSWHDSPYAEDL